MAVQRLVTQGSVVTADIIILTRGVGGRSVSQRTVFDIDDGDVDGRLPSSSIDDPMPHHVTGSFLTRMVADEACPRHTVHMTTTVGTYTTANGIGRFHNSIRGQTCTGRLMILHTNWTVASLQRSTHGKIRVI